MGLALLKNPSEVGISLVSSRDLVEIDLGYLLADQASPCSIYLFHAGEFRKTFLAGERIALADLAEMRERFYSTGFVSDAELETWDKFRLARHIRSKKLEILTDRAPSLKDRKILPQDSFRNGFVSYVFSAVTISTEGELEEKRLHLCQQFFRKVTKDTSIEWYFDKLDMDTTVKHGARTSFLSLLFASFNLPKMSLDSLETLVVSGILHQLEGDPASTSGLTTSVRTLRVLKENGRPISEKIITAIGDHDERFNGCGSPRGLVGDKINPLSRIFSIVNLFDHTYLRTQAASRRLRMDQSVAWLRDHEVEFDAKILERFLHFLRRVEIKE